MYSFEEQTAVPNYKNRAIPIEERRSVPSFGKISINNISQRGKYVFDPLDRKLRIGNSIRLVAANRNDFGNKRAGRKRARTFGALFDWRDSPTRVRFSLRKRRGKRNGNAISRGRRSRSDTAQTATQQRRQDNTREGGLAT